MKNKSFWRLRLLFVIVVVAAAAGIYVTGGPASSLNQLFLRTTVARHGTIEDVVMGHGLLVRSEHIVAAPHDGLVTLLASELQRVRPGQALLHIKQDPRQMLADELEKLERAVDAIDREADAEASEFQRRIAAFDERIAALEKEMIAALGAGNQSMTKQLEARLTAEYDDRTAVEDHFRRWRQQTESRRSALLAEKETLLTSVRVEETIITAEMPGTVTFHVDDYALPVAVGQVSDELWEAIGRTYVQRPVADGDFVTGGTTVLRLLDGLGSHLFVRFPKAPPVVQGQQVWLRWSDDTDTGVRARVHTAHTRPGETGVWFSLEQDSDRFAALRSLPNVQVITKRVNGIVLPKSAVTYRNDRPGVYMMADGSPVFRYVQLRGNDDRQFVVDDVPAGALVVINPRRIAK